MCKQMRNRLKTNRQNTIDGDPAAVVGSALVKLLETAAFPRVGFTIERKAVGHIRLVALQRL